MIGGRFKGRLIEAPKGVRLRPTKDIAKQALFNILSDKVPGGSFLELFAGSGSVGIEALSREAEEVVFVENNRLAIKSIAKNLQNIGVEYSYGLGKRKAKKHIRARLLYLDARKAVSLLGEKKEKFDLIFLDPPYYMDKLETNLLKICHYDILRPHSLVIAEHNQRQILPQQIAMLRLMFSKRYGDTILSFYQMKPRLMERK